MQHLKFWRIQITFGYYAVGLVGVNRKEKEEAEAEIINGINMPVCVAVIFKANQKQLIVNFVAFKQSRPLNTHGWHAFFICCICWMHCTRSPNNEGKQHCDGHTVKGHFVYFLTLFRRSYLLGWTKPNTSFPIFQLNSMWTHPNCEFFLKFQTIDWIEFRHVHTYSAIKCFLLVSCCKSWLPSAAFAKLLTLLIFDCLLILAIDMFSVFVGI